MIRRIVCSAAYRQSSAARGDISERDPKNRWLARQNRFRLEAESMRDTVLACSGLLDTRIGGPGFCVALSPDDAPEDWDPNKAPQAPLDIYRRGMYVIAKRTDPDAMLSALDAPDGTVSCPLRRRTNTPIQSLAFLNDPVFVDASRAMAKPADHVAPGDYDAWISSLFARCTSREPTAAEQNTLTELFHKVTLEYRDHPQEAAKLAQVEPDVPNAAEIAAALVVARSILNLDEVVTRE